LHTIVVARLRDDSQTRAYAARRKRAEGKSPKEALRCLKRVVARQLLKLLERCDRVAVELKGHSGTGIRDHGERAVAAQGKRL
jgi:hypothetical protein